jgi:hypothetical protein
MHCTKNATRGRHTKHSGVLKVMYRYELAVRWFTTARQSILVAYKVGN